MKFAQIAKGTRAEKSVPMPGVLAPDGSPVTFLVRPLTGAEESDVVAGAIAHARAKGVTNPKPGDELYDLGRMAHTLAIAALDSDSPSNARTTFFAGVDEILGQLHVENISFLYRHHELWQEECSPYERALDHPTLLQKVSEVAAAGGEASFIRMSPLTQWSFVRFLAAHVLTSLAPKSPSSSPSDGDGTTLQPAPPPQTSPTASPGEA